VAETIAERGAALTALIEDALPSVVAIRRELHANPQLAFEETYAAAVVQRELAADGIPFVHGLAGTGVVGWLEPGHLSPGCEPIALRADMDALPIDEHTGVPYASCRPGLMHACGHDGHMAILLGTARVLTHLRMRLCRDVKFLFQPAEEDGAGAARMIDAGALDTRTGGFAARRVFGLHAWPTLPLGTIGVRAGTLMAAKDCLQITIEGRGGHGAMPHLTADPVVAAAHVVVALQSIVSRNLDPNVPAVITISSMRAGQTTNVIPDRAELTGTVRSLDGAVRDLLHARIREVTDGVTRGLGCRAQVRLERGYPATINDPVSVQRVRNAAAAVLPPDAVIEIDHPCMAAEDFAFYGAHAPSCFFFLGTRPARVPAAAGLHTPSFDFNDDALRTGMRMMCQLALDADTRHPEIP
jgi:hippurate hydrolase